LCSGFLRYSPEAERKAHFEEVREASRMLRERVIPEFAPKLVEHVREEWRYYNATRGANENIISEAAGGLKNNNTKNKKTTTKKEKGKEKAKERDKEKDKDKEITDADHYLDNFRLKQLVHGQGINLRHLGRLLRAVRKLVPPGTPGLQDTITLLFVEMCARVLRYV
jgi:hypothetical protein